MTEVTANYDETWKEAITEYFDSFLQFFYPEIYAKVDWNKTPISLDKELEQRMFIYNYRAFDLYNQPVISLAILGDEF